MPSGLTGSRERPAPILRTPTPGWTAVSGPMFLRAEASADARQPVPVELAAGGVTLGRSSQTRHVLVAQLAHHLGGRTQEENPVGELLALGDGEDIPDVASWVVPHSVGPRFPGPLLIRTRC